MSISHASSGSIFAEASVTPIESAVGKLSSKIGTGICFLDHMIDQFTSHGMLGISLYCGIVDEPEELSCPTNDKTKLGKRKFASLRDYAAGMSSRRHDRDIFVASGAALGLALREVVNEVISDMASADKTGDRKEPLAASDTVYSNGLAQRSFRAVFCCPLDEAFAEVMLDLQPSPERKGRCTTNLEPYGKFASGGLGRHWVGRYRTDLTPVFWSSLATALQCDVSLCKIRGANAHHQLESTFKSFARAFRAVLDQVVDGRSYSCAELSLGPLAPAGPRPEPRTAERRRTTKETTIEVAVNLDAPWSFQDAPLGFLAAWTGKWVTATKLTATVKQTSRIVSGIRMLDDVLVEFAKAAGVEIMVHCEGDRYIDDHHTAEDVAITLGQCLHEALGDKAGLARMGCADALHGGARVRAVLDLSNRPHFESDLPFDEEYVGALDSLPLPVVQECDAAVSKPAAAVAVPPMDDLCGALLSCEMLHHIFTSLTLEMRATCHLQVMADKTAVGHTLDLALAAAKAYGSALSRAIRVDPRRGGAVASTKGTLSK